jgi:ribonuclease G
MSKELVVSANRHETRVALIEDEQVVEIYHQRENEYSLAGSIHKGRVTRVLPGMQSAFVDIGLERDAFLYVSDFFEDNEEYDKVVSSVEEKILKLDKPGAVPASLVAAPAAGEFAEAPEALAPPDSAEAAAPSAVAPLNAPPTGGRPPRNDDDRRGRRGRRRGRGGRDNRERGGRGGLPDSKFYSPGSEPAPVAAAEPEAEAEAEAPVVHSHTHTHSTSVDDDFFVLPGESLAKYSGEDGEEQEMVSDLAADPQPELEAATVEVAEAIVEPEPVAVPEPEPVAAAEPEPVAVAEPEPVAVAEPEPVAVAEAHAETAEDVDPVPTDAAEPVETSEPEATDAADAEQSRDSDGAVAEQAEGEPVEGEAVAATEEEGPEPARIPTSLTATLREQGPRYLHRVSRRMRRKGGPRDGAPEGNREPRPEGNREPGAREGGREGNREPRPDNRREGGREPREPRAEGGRPPQAQQDQRNVQPRAEGGRPDKAALPSISDLLREGQEIIVQIAKEPLGQKGARITSHIALPGRFLVYMPTVDHIGVSRKIPSDEERSRLKRVLQTNRVGIPGGYIVRTAGDGHTEEELRADMLFLYNLWLDMRQKAERRPAPMLIHHDLNVVERVLRDQLTQQFKSIWVDNEELYESVLRFVQRFQPSLVPRVKLYTRATPIFEEFGITSELEKALRPKVWLKSGGYIVINQTEALVAIDINTGKYVGKSNRLEDTIVKTNTDAIKEIVRQIRLRDLGGIIVVDFIDMDERKNRQKVMQALEEAMRSDRAPYKILQFNDFGLVAITRKRVKQSLERTLCTPCPYCEGAGYVKNSTTVIGEILIEAQKIAKAVEGKDVMLRVSPEVAKMLKSNQNSYLQELEEILGRTVIVKSDQQLHQEKFDLA